MATPVVFDEGLEADPKAVPADDSQTPRVALAGKSSADVSGVRHPVEAGATDARRVPGYPGHPPRIE
ncbi:hypothetical protein Pen01_52270 [Phytomonospora endophytica]|nr:hypothetical protein Pen01_52270 [Phytomonospora endophytica]